MGLWGLLKDTSKDDAKRASIDNWLNNVEVPESDPPSTPAAPPAAPPSPPPVMRRFDQPISFSPWQSANSSSLRTSTPQSPHNPYKPNYLVSQTGGNGQPISYRRVLQPLPYPKFDSPDVFQELPSEDEESDEEEIVGESSGSRPPESVEAAPPPPPPPAPIQETPPPPPPPAPVLVQDEIPPASIEDEMPPPPPPPAPPAPEIELEMPSEALPPPPEISESILPPPPVQEIAPEIPKDDSPPPAPDPPATQTSAEILEDVEPEESQPSLPGPPDLNESVSSDSPLDSSKSVEPVDIEEFPPESHDVPEPDAKPDPGKEEEPTNESAIEEPPRNVVEEATPVIDSVPPPPPPPPPIEPHETEISAGAAPTVVGEPSVKIPDSMVEAAGVPPVVEDAPAPPLAIPPPAAVVDETPPPPPPPSPPAAIQLVEEQAPAVEVPTVAAEEVPPPPTPPPIEVPFVPEESALAERPLDEEDDTEGQNPDASPMIKSVAFDPSVQDPKGGKLGKKDKKSVKAKAAKAKAKDDEKKAKEDAKKEKERAKRKKEEKESGETRRVTKDDKGRIVLVVEKKSTPEKEDSKSLKSKASTKDFKSGKSSKKDKAEKKKDRKEEKKEKKAEVNLKSALKAPKASFDAKDEEAIPETSDQALEEVTESISEEPIAEVQATAVPVDEPEVIPSLDGATSTPSEPPPLPSEPPADSISEHAPPKEEANEHPTSGTLAVEETLVNEALETPIELPSEALAAELPTAAAPPPLELVVRDDDNANEEVIQSEPPSIAIEPLGEIGLGIDGPSDPSLPSPTEIPVPIVEDPTEQAPNESERNDPAPLESAQEALATEPQGVNDSAEATPPLVDGFEATNELAESTNIVSADEVALSTEDPIEAPAKDTTERACEQSDDENQPDIDVSAETPAMEDGENISESPSDQKENEDQGDREDASNPVSEPVKAEGHSNEGLPAPEQVHSENNEEPITTHLEDTPDNLEHVPEAPVDIAPVDIAPVDIAPVDIAPVDIAPVDTAPIELIPIEVVLAETVNDAEIDPKTSLEVEQLDETDATNAATNDIPDTSIEPRAEIEPGSEASVDAVSGVDNPEDVGATHSSEQDAVVDVPPVSDTNPEYINKEETMQEEEPAQSYDEPVIVQETEAEPPASLAESEQIDEPPEDTPAAISDEEEDPPGALSEPPAQDQTTGEDLNSENLSSTVSEEVKPTETAQLISESSEDALVESVSGIERAVDKAGEPQIEPDASPNPPVDDENNLMAESMAESTLPPDATLLPASDDIDTHEDTPVKTDQPASASPEAPMDENTGVPTDDAQPEPAEIAQSVEGESHSTADIAQESIPVTQEVENEPEATASPPETAMADEPPQSRTEIEVPLGGETPTVDIGKESESAESATEPVKREEQHAQIETVIPPLVEASAIETEDTSESVKQIPESTTSEESKESSATTAESEDAGEHSKPESTEVEPQPGNIPAEPAQEDLDLPKEAPVIASEETEAIEAVEDVTPLLPVSANDAETPNTSSEITDSPVMSTGEAAEPITDITEELKDTQAESPPEVLEDAAVPTDAIEEHTEHLVPEETELQVEQHTPVEDADSKEVNEHVALEDTHVVDDGCVEETEVLQEAVPAEDISPQSAQAEEVDAPADPTSLTEDPGDNVDAPVEEVIIEDTTPSEPAPIAVEGSALQVDTEPPQEVASPEAPVIDVGETAPQAATDVPQESLAVEKVPAPTEDDQPPAKDSPVKTVNAVEEASEGNPLPSADAPVEVLEAEEAKDIVPAVIASSPEIDKAERRRRRHSNSSRPTSSPTSSPKVGTPKKRETSDITGMWSSLLRGGGGSKTKDKDKDRDQRARSGSGSPRQKPRSASEEEERRKRHEARRAERKQRELDEEAKKDVGSPKARTREGETRDPERRNNDQKRSSRRAEPTRTTSDKDKGKGRAKEPEVVQTKSAMRKSRKDPDRVTADEDLPTPIDDEKRRRRKERAEREAARRAAEEEDEEKDRAAKAAKMDALNAREAKEAKAKETPIKLKDVGRRNTDRPSRRSEVPSTPKPGLLRSLTNTTPSNTRSSFFGGLLGSAKRDSSPSRRTSTKKEDVRTERSRRELQRTPSEEEAYRKRKTERRRDRTLQDLEGKSGKDTSAPPPAPVDALQADEVLPPPPPLQVPDDGSAGSKTRPPPPLPPPTEEVDDSPKTPSRKERPRTRRIETERSHRKSRAVNGDRPRTSRTESDRPKPSRTENDRPRASRKEGADRERSKDRGQPRSGKAKEKSQPVGLGLFSGLKRALVK